MKKTILPIFWVLALLGIFKLADSFNHKSEHFFGIADNREQNISFEYPVEIIQALAVEGENVAQGMPILEVKRHDLISDQTTLDEKIRKLELEKQESINTITSQIESLNAKKQTESAIIDQQIHSLELKLNQRQSLIADISGTTNNQLGPAPESIEIADLEKKRRYSAQIIQAEIDNLQKQLNASSRPVDAQIAELKGNKLELQRQNKSLKVAAQLNGRIGSILYKPGDLVAAFQPIMTVHTSAPSSIKGYIHENILNEVQVNQVVWIKSLTLHQDALPLEGRVESLGNRIVEYPTRIKKDPAVSAWGREVVVRLNGNNSLLFGEKVDISLTKQPQSLAWLTIISKAVADFKDHYKSDNAANELHTLNTNIDIKNIEASALLWNSKENHYLLVSDEQYEDHAGIFILNKDLAVTGRLALKTDTAIDDLESISRNGDYIYVSSSLSYNKKNELKSKRRKLLRFKYEGNKVDSQQEIDLFDVLTKIKNAQPKSKLGAFLTEAMNEHSIDIESHFIKNNDLYLGFKVPFIDGSSAVIIKIDNIDALFADKKISANIWQTIALKDPDSGEPTELSDMLLMEDKLILLSVSRTSTRNSYLWSYMLNENNLKKLHQFSGVVAEGVTYRPDQNLLAVVFDEGKGNISKYQTIKLSSVIQ